MRKFLLIIQLTLVASLLSGCSIFGSAKPPTWQGVYYEHGKDENKEYGPVFSNYDTCRDWALFTKVQNRDDDVHCLKNCHDTLADGTPVCEAVVRRWAPFPGSDTFYNYQE